MEPTYKVSCIICKFLPSEQDGDYPNIQSKAFGIKAIALCAFCIEKMHEVSDSAIVEIDDNYRPPIFGSNVTYRERT